MNDAEVTLFICVTCNGQSACAERPGQLLYNAVADGVRARADCAVIVAPVECLAVCKRPCTVALAGNGKWSYVIGDLDHEVHVDDVIAASLSYAATDNGIIPWRERPVSFRRGVVSRIPPFIRSSPIPPDRKG